MYNADLDLRPECDCCMYFEDGICQKGVCIFRESDINLYDESESYENKGTYVITTKYKK